MTQVTGPKELIERAQLEQKLTFELVNMIDNPDRPENNQDVITMIQNWYLQEPDEQKKNVKLRTIIGLCGSQYDRVQDLLKIVGKTAFPTARPYNYESETLLEGCGYTPEEKTLVINFYDAVITRIKNDSDGSNVKEVEILEQAILENPDTNARLVAFVMVNLEDKVIQELANLQRQMQDILRGNIQVHIDTAIDNHAAHTKPKNDDDVN